MLANIFDPVQKCCANWPTRSNMYQHSPTSTNIRQQGEQSFPTCCSKNVGAMLANMLRWFKPAFYTYWGEVRGKRKGHTKNEYKNK